MSKYQEAHLSVLTTRKRSMEATHKTVSGSWSLSSVILYTILCFSLRVRTRPEFELDQENQENRSRPRKPGENHDHLLIFAS